jgi:peptidoglycan/xylan/chitin deacetylase (PgdA/CDA1 family)
MTHFYLRKLPVAAGLVLNLALLLTGIASAQTEVTTPATPAVPPGVARKAPAYILIKIDDLRNVNGKVHPKWQKVVNFLKERKIKGGVGIICNSLEGDNPEYVRWIKEQQASGYIEFWNHGYDHKEWTEDGKKLQEFLGTSYEFQKDHLAKCHKLAKEKLGFDLPAFGSPFNSGDENTVKAMQDDPDTKVWLYGNGKNPAGKLVLDRVGAVNIENPIFKPSLDKFVEGYNKYPNRKFFLIQGHPANWDDSGFEQFVKIVDFLTKEGAIFTTPSEYAKTVAAETATK